MSGKTHTALVATRNEGETWRDAAARHAREVGLEAEVLESFAEHIARGVGEGQAAWCALYDWDCLSLGEVPDEPEVPTTIVPSREEAGRP